jgi:hypothetical protein
MLGGHPDYVCVPEMQFKFDLLRLSPNGVKEPLDKADSLRALYKRSSFRIWELPIDLPALTHEPISYREFIAWLVMAYGEKVAKPTPSVWIDHTPKNARYAATLFRLFPEAKMIHIVRDGRAVAASVLPLDWGPNEIGPAARFWAERLAYGLMAESRWPDKVVRVHYEDLVQAPAPTLQNLCAGIDIEYHPAMSQAAGFQVPKYTAQQHALIGQAPDRSRVSGWETQLTPRQVEIFEHTTADLLEMLGYTLKFGLQAKKVSRRESLVSSIRELYKEFANRRRKRKRRRETVPI